jgi:hypothetical protein
MPRAALMTKASYARTAVRVSAWLLLGVIVFATLGPQSARPHLGDPSLERFGAYFLTSAAFVVAYPRRPWIIACAAVLTAILLEMGQLEVPGRDARLADALVKAIGGLTGSVLAAITLRFAGNQTGPKDSPGT